MPYITTIVSLIPVLIGLKEYNNLLWFYAMTGFVFNLLIAVILSKLFGLDILHINPRHLLATKQLLANLFIATEFVFLFTYYRRNITSTYRIPVYLSLFTLIYFLIRTAFLSGLHLTSVVNNFMVFTPSFTTPISVSYIVCCLFGYLSLIKEGKIVYLEKSSFFWFNTSVFIYSSGTVLLFLFIPLLKEINPVIIGKLWWINDTIDIISSLLLSIALFIKKTEVADK